MKKLIMMIMMIMMIMSFSGFAAGSNDNLENSTLLLKVCTAISDNVYPVVYKWMKMGYSAPAVRAGYGVEIHGNVQYYNELLNIIDEIITQVTLDIKTGKTNDIAQVGYNAKCLANGYDNINAYVLVVRASELDDIIGEIKSRP